MNDCRPRDAGSDIRGFVCVCVCVCWAWLEADLEWAVAVSDHGPRGDARTLHRRRRHLSRHHTARHSQKDPATSKNGFDTLMMVGYTQSTHRITPGPTITKGSPV
jgi:hypothetical protein